MKKIIILLALLCTGSICNAQYLFSTEDIVRTENPVLVFVKGVTTLSTNANEGAELKILSGNYQLIISFQNDCKIFSNWKIYASQLEKEWKNIIALDDSLSVEWEYLLKVKKSNEQYNDLLKQYIVKCNREAQMRTQWSKQMAELPVGNLGIYDFESGIPLQTYTLANSNFEYSIPSDAILIMGYVDNSNLGLALLLDISKLPDIFAKIFPISKKK